MRVIIEADVRHRQSNDKKSSGRGGFSGQSTKGGSLPAFITPKCHQGFSILIVIFLIKTIYMFVLTYFKIRYTQNRQLSLADRLFMAYMHVPYTFHLQRNTSELLRNIQVEVGGPFLGCYQPCSD